MVSRKEKIMRSINLLSEQRYLYNKFLKEQEEEIEIPKLQVSPIGKSPINSMNKYKVSLFQKQDNGNLKDIMSDDILKKLNLKIVYADRESAEIDVSKVTADQLKNVYVEI
jgi:hypothetical protein